MSAGVLVAFTGVWLCDPTAPSTSLTLHMTAGARAEKDTLSGSSVRVYAGGRRRIITTPADDRQSALTFQRASSADVEQLRAWRGRLLLLRDGLGWRRWGTFFDLQAQPATLAAVEPLTVQLTWLDSDYDEAV